jgi:preprotein translocase subunit YajC
MTTYLFLTLADAVPTTGATPSATAPSQWIFLVGLACIFYFLILRPQQKRQKEQATLISSVKTGDEVVMSSGIHGIVTNVKDSTVIVKVADNVKIEFDKAAVAAISKVSPAS